MNGMAKRRTMLGLALAVTLGLAATPARADDTGDRMLADQLAMLARWVLQGPAEPVPAQLTQAQMLLDEALALQQDEELWHLRIELATAMQDEAARLEALRRYTRLRPDDDVAATALALAEAEQDVPAGIEGRLERLEQLLEAEHPDTVRSRIASHAAALAFELGDDARMRELLATAVRLDRHNVQAARLLLDRAMRRETGSRQVGLAAINLVRRAPADPLGRLTLAEALLRDGDYAAAARQIEVTQRLTARPMSRRAYLSWAVALAGAGEDEALTELLDQLSGRFEQDPDDGSPLEAELPLDFELLRLASTQRPDVLARRVDRMIERYEELEGQLTRAQRRAARLDLASTASLFGHALQRVDDWLEDQDHEDARVRRSLGLAAMHLGEAERAREHLEPLAETDTLAALGLTMLASDEAQLEALEAVFRREPQRLAGVLAARRLREAGREVSPGEASRALHQSMLNDSRQLWEPALRSSPWLVLRVRGEAARTGYLEPIPLRLELRNTARFAIALAPDAGIPTQAVLMLSPRVGGQPMSPPGPMVVDLHRRLVLEPGERLSVPVRLDRSSFGAMSAANPQLNITYGVRALIGARQTVGGGLAPGPVGYQDELRAMNISAQRIGSEAELEALLEQLETGGTAQRLRAMAALVRLGEALPEAMDGPEPRQRITEAVTAAYQALEPRQQAFVHRFVRRPDEGRAMFAELLEHARASDEPVVWMVHLTAQAQEEDHPSLQAALAHENERVRRFAAARQEALRYLAELRARIERQRELEQRQQPDGPIDLDL